MRANEVARCERCVAYRDDRSTAVVSGLWHFGYGAHANDPATVALPAGSYYTEPAGDSHR